MTEAEELGYEEQLRLLTERLNKRTEKIQFFKNQLRETGDCGEIDFYIGELDKMLSECKMDIELKEDILNMLEVEHFLEYGAGRTFDEEY